VNRSDAVRELEQTIEWMMATLFEGRCPRCEALALGTDTVLLQTSSPGTETRTIRDGARIGHTDACPADAERFFERAGYLCERFGLEVEFTSEGRGDMSYYGPRFVRQRGGDRNSEGLFLIGPDRYTYLSHDGSWHEANGDELLP
jgi:hypothetical protein